MIDCGDDKAGISQRLDRIVMAGEAAAAVEAPSLATGEGRNRVRSGLAPGGGSLERTRL